jgi:bifunctional non-homologous end joining protein LigD
MVLMRYPKEGSAWFPFGARRYGIKKHDARRLHYDLRLELDGVLLSWVLPEGPSYQASVIREAVEVEEHRDEHLTFEGEHESGTIMLWDRGAWEPYPSTADIGESLRIGILRFVLYGEKLKGVWILIRKNNFENVRHRDWTLCKCNDQFAESSTSKPITDKMPNSISTGRSMGEIRKQWRNPRDRYEHQMKLF